MTSNASLKRNWRNALLPSAAISLSLIVSGCASVGREPIVRNLPAAPAFAQPVSVQEPRVGEPQLAIAARERSARKQNAAIITRFRGWYWLGAA
jgi:hypothetical protein